MMRPVIYLFALGVEVFCMVRAGLADAYDEKSFWVSLATYTAVVTVAWRQIANGHSLFPDMKTFRIHVREPEEAKE